MERSSSTATRVGGVLAAAALTLAGGAELSAHAQQYNPGQYNPGQYNPGQYNPNQGQYNPNQGQYNPNQGQYNPGYNPGYNSNPGYGGGYGGGCAPGQFCPNGGMNGGMNGSYTPPAPLKATGLERGYLYVTAASWGIATGAWIDVAADISDPGFAILPPLLFGAVVPGAIGITDFAIGGFPRGVPASIATGTLLGSVLGLGISGYEATNGNNWSANGILASEFIGSTTGAVLGTVGGLLLKPSPKTSMLMMSSAFWGGAIGAEFGGAASNGAFDKSDQDILLGGLIGYGLGVATTGTVSIFWVPSWNQLAWMWAGFGIGEVATTPIYLFYIGGSGEPRRGLIAQGIGGLLGAGLFALIGDPDQPNQNYTADQPLAPGHKFQVGKVMGGSVLPTPELHVHSKGLQVGAPDSFDNVGWGLQGSLTGVLY